MKLKQTWKTFLKHKKLIPMPVISDLIFYFLLSWLTIHTTYKLTAIAETIMTTFGELANIIGTDIMQNAQIIEQYKQVSQTMLIFIAATLALWMIFKGINWYYAHLMTGKTPKTKEFIVSFFTKTIIWFLISLAVIFIAGFINYKILISQSNISGPETTFTISIILIWIISYFGLIAYSLNTTKYIKTTFKAGIKQWKQTIPAYLLSTITIILSIIIFYNIFIRNFYISIIILILIILPAIQYMRMLTIESIKKR